MDTPTQVTAPTASKALTIHPKVSASALGGAVALVVLYCLQSIWNVTVPAETAATITLICTFVCGYLAPGEAVV